CARGGDYAMDYW
nr:immunoglobulin heavy chain junction region [Mus musculus]MBK4184009.1 immunoglobulin heavy chain junction region [Mus musculus]MBK4184010.1 immunoglobulin heavy chain junction region [Mus musculus]MBK4184011.1 immunoglobulin heavy chain junction region [Mus musculus]MBK4184012.1 immunoglobulin heavy chain junction region [Mus musculus]